MISKFNLPLEIGLTDPHPFPPPTVRAFYCISCFPSTKFDVQDSCLAAVFTLNVTPVIVTVDKNCSKYYPWFFVLLLLIFFLLCHLCNEESVKSTLSSTNDWQMLNISDDRPKSLEGLKLLVH